VIAVGVDGSPPSQRAIRWAGQQAKLTGTTPRAASSWRWPNDLTMVPTAGADVTRRTPPQGQRRDHRGSVASEGEEGQVRRRRVAYRGSYPARGLWGGSRRQDQLHRPCCRVDGVAPATGLPQTIPVVIVAAERETFCSFDLANVVPEATPSHVGAAMSKSPCDCIPAGAGRAVARSTSIIVRFNPSPGWPAPPEGWNPPPGCSGIW